MTDLTFELGAKDLEFILEATEEDAFSDQSILLKGRTIKLELLLKESQFRQLFMSMLEHVLNSQIFDDLTLDRIQDRIRVRLQDNDCKFVQAMVALTNIELARL